MTPEQAGLLGEWRACCGWLLMSRRDQYINLVQIKFRTMAPSFDAAMEAAEETLWAKPNARLAEAVRRYGPQAQFQ